jgi:NitT/TauT family transport system ATP-binding protein
MGPDPRTRWQDCLHRIGWRPAPGTPWGEDAIAPEPLIAAAGIIKTYRTVSGGRVNAIAGIDLAIDDGDFVCIVGPSGCGKSSFLRLVAGLDTVSAGVLTLSGAPVRGPSREVGIVFQNATLLPWMTVLENVGLPLRVGGRAGGDDAFVHSLLAMVGLAGFADKYPYELSGGMQQRAAICRALVRDPKVLLMDEPFGALDALTRERMNVELQRIWQASRKTVLLITHSIAEAVFLGDRVVVMSPRPGRILEDFRVDLARPRNFSETTGDPEYLRLTRAIRTLLDLSAGEEAR